MVKFPKYVVRVTYNSRVSGFKKGWWCQTALCTNKKIFAGVREGGR